MTLSSPRPGDGTPPARLSRLVAGEEPWGAALQAGLLAGLAVALALAGVLLVLVPQRLAQRPVRQGVITLHLDQGGRLRLWNQPIRQSDLLPLLRRALDRRPSLRLRLVPAPSVSWGSVQAFAASLESLPVALELQLP